MWYCTSYIISIINIIIIRALYIFKTIGQTADVLFVHLVARSFYCFQEWQILPFLEAIAILLATKWRYCNYFLIYPITAKDTPYGLSFPKEKNFPTDNINNGYPLFSDKVCQHFRIQANIFEVWELPISPGIYSTRPIYSVVWWGTT